MPVITAPVSTPSKGLLNLVMMLANSGISASGATALDIMCMPYMSTAKPQRTAPIVFCFCRLENIAMITPITASTGVKDVGLSSCTKSELPCMPVKLRIHAVAVVPMFAPMMMPTA